MKKISIRFIRIVLGALFLPLSGFGQMLAQINTPVTTDFGTYTPCPATFTPAVPLFQVGDDLSQLVNYDALSAIFTDRDRELLKTHHFTVQESQFKQLHDIYNDCTWSGTPIFVTTDAVLHIYHVLFDKMLADLEEGSFFRHLDRMTRQLIAEAQTDFDRAIDSDVREAARRNLAFLWTAQQLITSQSDTPPSTVAALVDSELTLITGHEGYAVSPVFGDFSALDYSQFQPRGHYTQNEFLRAYFKTMMWYGWTIFTMETPLFGELSRRHTLQALLLTQWMYGSRHENTPLMDLWSAIYEPTSFFAGRTDDPNLRHYYTLALDIYGADFLTLNADALADSSSLAAFMNRALELPAPQIPNWIYGTMTPYKGFRFMGQRYTPDSYLFGQLVLPAVTDRFFPKGLDVMAVLGSGQAWNILDTVYNETRYGGYSGQIQNAQTEFEAKPAADWAQNLYWNWLYTLMPLFYEKGAGYPYFMQNAAWQNKELMTALASWAELRHDTILYAKQSASPCGIPPGPPKSYVEPNPHLYARLAALVQYTRNGLEGLDLLLPEYQEKLTLFYDLLIFLRNTAVKELENTPLTRAEYDNIFAFGKVMQRLVSYMPDPENPWDTKADDMAVIADVHTDSNSNRCLEEGVGYPLEIYVIVNEGGVPRITRGAMFSYYEFTQPIANRLTDEAWREMLNGSAPPELPLWAASFMDADAVPPQRSQIIPDNLFSGEFTPVKPSSQPLLTCMRLLPAAPNPFNPVTTLRFENDRPVRVQIHIYNVRGRRVATLVDAMTSAGVHHVTWNGTDQQGRGLPSGLYLVEMRAGDTRHIQKISMLK